MWNAEIFAANAAGRHDIHPLSLLPYPNWATLKIWRGDSVIEVNLQEAIEACQESTIAEEARGWDQPLEWGDVVEVGVKSADVPWTGFTDETRRLFRKALQRQVVLQDGKGLVRSVTMRYVPSHYFN